MMFAHTATTYWANYFNCPPAELFATPRRVMSHGPQLADYWGAIALFRDERAIASLPADHAEARQAVAQWQAPTPAAFAASLSGIASKVIGPAYIGYTSQTTAPTHPVVALSPTNAAAFKEFQHACPPTDWEHGGCSLTEPCSGVFVGSQLVAVAGYEIWGQRIAHLSIITHPNFRGHGYAHSAVAHLTARAISVGLLPQYRTLDANIASLRVAESLGFQRYATSMAVRFAPPGT